MTEEQETEPRVEWVDGYDEKNSDNPSLLIGACVVS